METFLFVMLNPVGVFLYGLGVTAALVVVAMILAFGERWSGS